MFVAELWVVNPSVKNGEILVRFEDTQNLDLTVDHFSMTLAHRGNIWLWFQMARKRTTI